MDTLRFDVTHTGNRNLQAGVVATGELARSILRTVRGEIPELLAECTPAIEEAIGKNARAKAEMIIGIVLEALAPPRLEDEDIERVLEQCWAIV